MRISLKVMICSVVLVAMGSLVYAGFTRSEDAIRYRKAVMTVIGQHFGRLAAVVKGQTPYDKKDVEHDAMVIRTMAELPWDAVLFPGSDRGDTTLKASAMQEKDRFMSMARQFENAAQNMAATANRGDLQSVKAQFGEVAGTCKTCHSTYRKR